MTAPTPSPRPKLKSPSPNCRPSDALWYASPPRRRANSTSSVSPRPAAGTTNCSRARSQHGRCPQFFLVRATQSRSSHSPMPRMSCWSRRRCWRSRHALFGPWPGPRPAACTTAAWRRRRRGAASGTRLIAARCSPPHPLTSWPQAAAQGLRRRRWLDCSCRRGCAAPARTQAVASIAVYWQLIFLSSVPAIWPVRTGQTGQSTQFTAVTLHSGALVAQWSSVTQTLHWSYHPTPTAPSDVVSCSRAQTSKGQHRAPWRAEA